MSGKHTPGPWAVGRVQDVLVVFAGKRSVCDIVGDMSVDIDNALLIAAAPDLLNVLKSMVEVFREVPVECAYCNYGDGGTGKELDGTPCLVCHPQRTVLEDADRAISKAEGRS